MVNGVSPKKNKCVVCVDTGTTNTRVWLACGDQVTARAHDFIGVRDTARDGSPVKLRMSLCRLIAEVRAGHLCEVNGPSLVVAAGMVTSSLGLVEVPHVIAPAGATELAMGTKIHKFPDVTDLPVMLIPGVRSGFPRPSLETVGMSDVMRGEETLCIGLVELRLVKEGGTVLNLGSHWKAIRMGSGGRIVASTTSIAGELIHAAQTQTILASAVPCGRPSALVDKRTQAGMNEQRRSGLARALFCVRLLEQSGEGTPEERLSYLVGAFVAADLDTLTTQGMIAADSLIVITGGGGVAEAWRYALSSVPTRVVTLSEAQV